MIFWCEKTLFFAIISSMNELLIKKKKFVVESTLAVHEDHTTYSCVYSGVHYMVRTYDKDYEQVLADYKTLKHAGINMAKMDFHDDERKIIAFDYFPEKDALERLSEGPLPEEYFAALFSLYRFARFSKISLSWEPQNFMLRGSQMFYLPHKVAKLTEENGLEKGGLATWFLGKEGIANLARKGYDVSKFTPMSEAEVNKAMTLMAVKYW